ncbi:MAG TPA: hypothetical protein VE198_11660 [Actinoallomurus sp.]|nr:hypothetical protein [Actinoallomurus sp.]
MDLRAFKGTVAESPEATLAGRRTTSRIAPDTGALAAVNGGFFVIPGTDGVVGDSAGIIVEHGRLLHDATNGRVAAILGNGGRTLRLQKLWTRIDLVDEHGSATTGAFTPEFGAPLPSGEGSEAVLDAAGRSRRRRGHRLRGGLARPARHRGAAPAPEDTRHHRHAAACD